MLNEDELRKIERSNRAKGALLRAMRDAGGSERMAQELGITPQAVRLWVLNGRCPAERVPDVVRITRGRISAAKLRGSR